MMLLCFCSLVTEDNLNLHLLNEIQFSEIETQSKHKLTQPDHVDNIITTILGKNIFICVENKLVLVAMD